MPGTDSIRDLIQTLIMIFVFIVILQALLPELAEPVLEIFRTILDPNLILLFLLIAILGFLFRDR